MLSVPFKRCRTRSFGKHTKRPPRGIRGMRGRLDFSYGGVSSNIGVCLDVSTAPGATCPDTVSLNGTSINTIVRSNGNGVLGPGSDGDLLRVGPNSLCRSIGHGTAAAVATCPIDAAKGLPTTKSCDNVTAVRIRLRWRS